MLRRGQAMLETVLAVIFVTFVFLVLFGLSRLLTEKILLEHAAMRVARARAVGFNEFQCLKAARVAVIPVAGERLWPGKDDDRTKDVSETALAQMYLRTPDSAYADGLLRYEKWNRLTVVPGSGGATTVRIRSEKESDEGEKSWFSVQGEAVVDGFPIYLNNLGL